MFRKDFPLFIEHPEYIYLDSASTAQKPKKVLDAIQGIFTHAYANIHRGSYTLSEQAEVIYDGSKEKVKEFFHANSRHEIIYTYNATYAFNLLSRSLVKTGILVRWDRVLLSLLDHHANIVPWQIIAEEYGIVIEWIGVTEDGRIDMDDLSDKISWVKLISITAASNVTGAITDLEGIRDIIHAQKERPLFIVDGSQRLPHMATNVTLLDIDFFIATGHKVMSDTGIGILYGKKHLLKSLVPALCGWWAINSVTVSGYEPAGLPFRHEPWTPHIAGAASLLAALEYIEDIGGYEVIEGYEKELTEYTLWKIAKLPSSIHLLGPKNPENRLWVFSFYFDNVHAGDIAHTLADMGVSVRAGHHCTEPLHTSLGIAATLRMSLYMYNTKEDIDAFINALTKSMDF